MGMIFLSRFAGWHGVTQRAAAGRKRAAADRKRQIEEIRDQLEPGEVRYTGLTPWRSSEKLPPNKMKTVMIVGRLRRKNKSEEEIGLNPSRLVKRFQNALRRDCKDADWLCRAITRFKHEEFTARDCGKSTRKLGDMLSRLSKRPLGTYQVVRCGKTHGVTRWKIVNFGAKGGRE